MLQCQGKIDFTLLPGSLARVCQAGDPLELTCTTNGTSARWTFHGQVETEEMENGNGKLKRKTEAESGNGKAENW